MVTPRGGDKSIQGAGRGVRDAQRKADALLGKAKKKAAKSQKERLVKGKVPLRESGTNLKELRLEYVTNPHATYASLAERHGIALNTIAKAATEGKWTAERAEYWDRVSEEAKQAGIARWRQVATRAADRLERTLDQIEGVSGLLIERLMEESKKPADPDDMRRLEDRVVEIEKVAGETKRDPETGRMVSVRNPRSIRKTVRRGRAMVDPRKLAVVLKTHVDLLRATLLRDDDTPGSSGDVFHIE